MFSFPLEFPNKTLYAPFLSLLHAIYPTYLLLLDLISRIMFVEEFKWGASDRVIFSTLLSSLLGPNAFLFTLESKGFDLF